jgi:cob(I)alamin adenosyltransferase
MVKINRVYTKTGDDGTTGLVGGSRTRKDSRQIMTVGEIDELNAHLGLVYSNIPQSSPKWRSQRKILLEIISRLFDIGAEIASPPELRNSLPCLINKNEIAKIEAAIDKINGKLAELRSFVLPGSSKINALCHLARSICRRVERTVVTNKDKLKLRDEILIYLNRLSDLLFVMARQASKNTKDKELLWQPLASSTVTASGKGDK